MARSLAYPPEIEDLFRLVPDLRKIKSSLGREPEVGADELLIKVVEHVRVRKIH